MTTELRTHLSELERNICSVVLGKDEVVRMCLVALLAGEHVLLEDVPGVGKTLVGRAIAKSVSADFARVQFTPDLLPSDIIGGSIFDTQTSEFVFKRGVHVLGHEINIVSRFARINRQFDVMGVEMVCCRFPWDH